jgi:preprotein translocase YajC subunit
MSDTLFFFLALTFLGVWIFISGRNRKKAAEKLRAEVVKGAYVMLTSGIYGKILAVKDDRVELETAPGQKLTVAIGAVRGIEEPPKKASPAKPASSSATSSVTKPKAPKADSGK